MAGLLRAEATAALFVTHDLDEALEVGDRVAVLRAGRVVQVAAPADLIDAPADPWTARFVGHANVWTGAAAAQLPGAPAAALLHEGRARWTAEPVVGGTPARVAAVVRRREGWRLTLDAPAWGVAIEWSAAPREFAAGRPPDVGQHRPPERTRRGLDPLGRRRGGDRVRAVVLVGGAVVATPELRARATGRDLVVAADGGLRHAATLGLAPDLLVGDLDSVGATTRARYPELATEAHPVDKDALDLELALDAAAARGATEVLVVGGLSGRLDQTLATVAIAQARRADGLAVDVADGVRSVWPLRPGETRRLALVAGTRFSLLPLDELALVSVAGARYPLARASLARAQGRGVSNEARGPVVVTAHAGAVVVVAPGADAVLDGTDG